MADLEDVRRLALALPEVVERPTYGGVPSWAVRGKAFVWERPLRAADVAALADPPQGTVLGVQVADEGVKQALLAAEPALLTTPHFDGYPVVLVRLDEVAPEQLEELVVDAWLARAPKRLAAAWLEERQG